MVPILYDIKIIINNSSNYIWSRVIGTNSFKRVTYIHSLCLFTEFDEQYYYNKYVQIEIVILFYSTYILLVETL